MTESTQTQKTDDEEVAGLQVAVEAAKVAFEAAEEAWLSGGHENALTTGRALHEARLARDAAQEALDLVECGPWVARYWASVMIWLREGRILDATASEEMDRIYGILTELPERESAAMDEAFPFSVQWR